MGKKFLGLVREVFGGIKQVFYRDHFLFEFLQDLRKPETPGQKTIKACGHSGKDRGIFYQGIEPPGPFGRRNYRSGIKPYRKFVYQIRKGIYSRGNKGGFQMVVEVIPKVKACSTGGKDDRDSGQVPAVSGHKFSGQGF